EAVVSEAFLPRRPASTERVHQVDTALLEHARLDDGLDVVATALFDNDRFDTLEVQDVRQQQSGRAGADDADLRSDLFHDALPPCIVRSGGHERAGGRLGSIRAG